MRKAESPAGLYWHAHHHTLVECLREGAFEDRVHAIRSWKARAERDIRLAYFAPVKGPLPPMVQAAIDALPPWNCLCDNLDFWTALNEIGYAIEVSGKAIAELHEAEHPDCPWDGESILHLSDECPVPGCNWVSVSDYGDYRTVRQHVRRKHNALLRPNVKTGRWDVIPRQS